MSVEALREIISRLSPSAHSLAVVAAALHARSSGEPLPPPIQPHVDQVLRALGALDAFDAVAERDAAPLLGELQTFAFSRDAFDLRGSRARSSPSRPSTRPWLASIAPCALAAGCSSCC